MVQAASGGWKRILAVGAFALATVIGADVALHAVAPPVHLREIDDSIAEYEASDPTILVLGSSHARSFVVMGEELVGRTGGSQRMMPVPVEWGKFSSYEWVLNERILPVLDEVDASGARVRPSLRRAMIITEWWDSTDLQFGQRGLNLPARAWGWRHFLGDVVEHGLTPFNGNFLGRKWGAWMASSTLVSDRGHGQIVKGLKHAIRGRDLGAIRDERQRQLQGWKKLVEAGVEALCDPVQMSSLEAIVTALEDRGLDVTIVLYPRMPGTLTDSAKRTTLAEFARRMAAFASAHGIRLVDIGVTSPLTDDDFEEDFDHITPAGNRRLAEWALDGELRFLVEEAGTTPATPPPRQASRPGGLP